MGCGAFTRYGQTTLQNALDPAELLDTITASNLNLAAMVATITHQLDHIRPPSPQSGQSSVECKSETYFFVAPDHRAGPITNAR
jgi:hypothetical protein